MSDQLLDVLLAEIEDRASTFDPWETTSGRSSIRGIGTVAGKAIMNVGIGVIRGISYVNVRTALARIARAQRRSGVRLSQTDYQDIVEYQRYAPFSMSSFHVLNDPSVQTWNVFARSEHRGLASHAGRTPPRERTKCRRWPVPKSYHPRRYPSLCATTCRVQSCRVVRPLIVVK